MEMIINDKNVEIDILKDQHLRQEKQMEKESQDLAKQNSKMKKMIDNLEK